MPSSTAATELPPLLLLLLLLLRLQRGHPSRRLSSTAATNGTVRSLYATQPDMAEHSATIDHGQGESREIVMWYLFK